jgi:hypothetical protein
MGQPREKCAAWDYREREKEQRQLAEMHKSRLNGVLQWGENYFLLNYTPHLP